MTTVTSQVPTSSGSGWCRDCEATFSVKSVPGESARVLLERWFQTMSGHRTDGAWGVDREPDPEGQVAS